MMNQSGDIRFFYRLAIYGTPCTLLNQFAAYISVIPRKESLK